jgi:hypothetical protein
VLRKSGGVYEHPRVLLSLCVVSPQPIVALLTAQTQAITPVFSWKLNSLVKSFRNDPILKSIVPVWARPTMVLLGLLD